MAIVKIKGYDEAIEIGFVQANEIKRIWEDRTKPNDIKIDLDGMNCTKGDIRWINLKTQPDNTQVKQNVVQTDQQYTEERKKILAMTPEQKANRLGMFEFLCYCVTGKKEVPEKIREKAREIQLEFFKENPKRTVCEPILFKSLFPINVQKGYDNYRSGGMRVVENMLIRDKAEMKYDK